MKKVLALVMALALILAMSITAIAEVNLEGFEEGWTFTDVGPKKIGVVPWSMAHEFNSICAETCKALCEQLGWEATIYDPDADWTKMQQILEDLIIQGVDGIIYTAIDTVAASAVVDQVHEAGIKIVNYDCCASEGNADMDVVYDDYQGGVFGGEACVEALKGKGKEDDVTIVVFDEEPSIMTSGPRVDGFCDAILAAYPNANIIKNRTADRTNDGCYQWALDMYTTYQDVDAFFCWWGDCATSAWYALQSAEATDVVMIGYDATQSHLDIMLEDGPDSNFYASVGMFPDVYAVACVEKLDEIFAGTYTRQGPEDQVKMTPEVLYAAKATEWIH